MLCFCWRHMHSAKYWFSRTISSCKSCKFWFSRLLDFRLKFTICVPWRSHHFHSWEQINFETLYRFRIFFPVYCVMIILVFHGAQCKINAFLSSILLYICSDNSFMTKTTGKLKCQRTFNKSYTSPQRFGQFLWRQRSKAPLRDYFFSHLSRFHNAVFP